MKIPSDTINFMKFLNDFRKNHSKYDLGNFDISLRLFSDLSYNIEIEFVDFSVKVNQHMSVKVNEITISPDKDLPIEDWVLTGPVPNYFMVKVPFVKWISENLEMFNSIITK